MSKLVAAFRSPRSSCATPYHLGSNPLTSCLLTRGQTSAELAPTHLRHTSAERAPCSKVHQLERSKMSKQENAPVKDASKALNPTLS